MKPKSILGADEAAGAIAHVKAAATQSADKRAMTR
jgi:hypothetical protein